MGMMKTLGLIMLIGSIVGLVLGIGLTIGIPGYFLSEAMGADEFDAWRESASEGDTQEFAGTIAEKANFPTGGYLYKFEGCDNGHAGVYPTG